MEKTMTETERKKWSYQIATVLRTKPMYLYIERVEQVSESEKNVFVTYKGNKIGALMRRDEVIRTWRVIA